MSEQYDLAPYPHLSGLTAELLSEWPEHKRVVDSSLRERSPALLAHSDHMSDLIRRLSAVADRNLTDVISDYRFLCEKIVMPEEVHFRRHGSYRLSKFEDALNQVYNDRTYMNRYMSGLLVSAVYWLNHANASYHYASSFLPSVKEGANLLEVGPGHGLLMYLAAMEPRVATLTGWDVSDTSLAMTREALVGLGVSREFQLARRNIFELPEDERVGGFDAIVFSEVLEHLEEPVPALRALLGLLAPGGKIWINVPANSPAPDHLYLIRKPEEAAELARTAGFEVLETEAFPTAGATLDRALKQALAISCVVVARRPN